MGIQQTSGIGPPRQLAGGDWQHYIDEPATGGGSMLLQAHAPELRCTSDRSGSWLRTIRTVEGRDFVNDGESLIRQEDSK